jgi:hypothetical protein
LFEYSAYDVEKKIIIKEFKKSDENRELLHISGYNILSGSNVNLLSNIITGVLIGFISFLFF